MRTERVETQERCSFSSIDFLNAHALRISWLLFATQYGPSEARSAQSLAVSNFKPDAYSKLYAASNINLYRF
jgi:hypothetical protein